MDHIILALALAGAVWLAAATLITELRDGAPQVNARAARRDARDS